MREWLADGGGGGLDEALDEALDDALVTADAPPSRPPPPPSAIGIRVHTMSRTAQPRTIGDIYVNHRGHHRVWSGHKLWTVCDECILEGVVRHANYTNSDGVPNSLCASHAAIEGTHYSRYLCHLCPKKRKRVGMYNDETGLPHRLCECHARELGTYPLRLCVQCPPFENAEATHKDETGKRCLCETHGNVFALSQFVQSI